VKKVLAILVLTGILLTVGCQENQQSQRNPAPTVKKNNLKSFHEAANSILHRSLSSDSGAIRANAIEVVFETGRMDMMPSVVRLLRDNSVAVRFTAIIAIGDMNYTAGALSVKPTLVDNNPNIRIAAAYTLTKMGKESLESMITSQIKNKNQTIRANSALLLGKLGKKDALSSLKWVLNDEESNYLSKIQAIEAIAMLGVDNDLAYKRLWPLLLSKHGDDRISGIRGMRELNTSESKTAIGTMLIDDMLEVRLFAAYQLGRMRDFSGKNEILTYFTNLRPRLNEASQVQADRLAAMAIGRIGGPELEKYLPILLNSKYKDVQLRAAQAILLLVK
jgi:HEAT repeat protein